MKLNKKNQVVLLSLALAGWCLVPNLVSNASEGEDEDGEFSTATQVVCTQVGTETDPLEPSSDMRWKTGLSTEIDHAILGCDVVAHKIRWFSGEWSDWFVVGVNDIDYKLNPVNNSLRRRWCYFTDHSHLYIKC